MRIGVGRNAGFSLIELMIVIMIIGVLSAISLSGYREYVVRANRAAAQSYLLTIASKEEEYAIRNGAYATGANFRADLKLSEPEEVTKFYTVRVDALTNGFKVVAAVNPGTQQTADGNLTLDHRGAKTGHW